MLWETIANWFFDQGWRILLIIVLGAVVFFLICHFAPLVISMAIKRRMVGKSKREIKKRANTLVTVTVNTWAVIIGLGVLFTILSELGINIAPALAGIGIAGVAVGFGAQSMVKDFLAGIFIILENQFAIGDVVKIADVTGLVEDINLRRTLLRDLDGVIHVVPNGEIKVASNYTQDWSRVNMNISVAYGEDLDRVIEVINRVGNEIAEDPKWAEDILKAPQALRVDALGDSGIDIKILGETKPLRQWDVTGELRLRLKKTFDKENIEIPWPHTKVYFGNRPTEVKDKSSDRLRKVRKTD